MAIPKIIIIIIIIIRAGAYFGSSMLPLKRYAKYNLPLINQSQRPHGYVSVVFFPVTLDR